MSLRLQVSRVPIPDLEFGGSGFYPEPRRGLLEAGPFDLRFGSAHRTQLRIAVVGPAELIRQGLGWLDRFAKPIATINKATVPDFPGFSTVFRSELVFGRSFTAALDDAVIERALAMKPYDGFHEIVRAYAVAFKDAKREFRPDVILCCISDAIQERFWNVQRPLTRDERKAVKQVAQQRETTQLELPFDWQSEEEPEDLLRRDLRRALKAEAMRLEVPIQIARVNLFLDLKSNEEAAVRAWNSGVGLYYKAGGIPWRIRKRGPETCYVGVTFHHLRTNKRSLVYSALAQAFSSNGEGFALKGSAIEPDPDRRSPHMSSDQAMQLGSKVLAEYLARNGTLPKRIVLHKSSRFWTEEQEGFSQAFRNVPVVQMVALAPSSLRFVTHASYPPSRGTLFTIEGQRHFLFTAGYVRELGTYPGPHIPTPVELIFHNQYTNIDLHEAAADALALGRLNWNTSDLRSSQPVTLGFARRVGGIMAEYGLFEEKEPDPSYRYYM